MTTNTDHARQNAAGWAATIAALVAALECDFARLEELRDERADLVSENESAAAEGPEEEQKARAALDAWDAENGEELRELTEAADCNGEPVKDADEARERIEQSPLSVEVRTDWHAPGADDEKPTDFRVLLTTGGPALQIRGELDEHGTPTRAWLEFKDWGTGWTQYHDIDAETLLTFAGCFYFGE